MNDDREAGFEEVRGEAQQRGARPARCVDPEGKSPARQVLKARILLKADASICGESWSDRRIAEALDTSTDTVVRTRRQLVEGGVDGALIRKHSPHSARQCIFDGEAEAKLIAPATTRSAEG